MGIGILYESKEWSSYALEKNVNDLGVAAKLIDMQGDSYEEELLSYDLIVNRVPASAVFRGHQKALDRMPGVIDLLKEKDIPMINTYEAHYYETSKSRSTLTLGAHGFPVPKVFGVFSPSEITEKVELEYPCIIKPDCGGRTNCTFIFRSWQELAEGMKNAPDIKYIAEEYLTPEFGFLTRVEVIDGVCRLIHKKSVTDCGLAAYWLGSTFTAYHDISSKIKDTAIRAMDLLQIGSGSMDIIENRRGFFIIDINSISNASEDGIEIFQFDLMKETAAYIVEKYMKMSA
ncbi:MAG: ATP-grasp domain-containing protein [Clostridiales bacterium]|nr:ATP-grasp domain-containing protein [Clostridiales bacterium]